MTEAEWQASEDPTAMLRWVTCAGPSGDSGLDLKRWSDRPSDRKLRLFAAACCRQFWHLLTDHRSRHAVEVAERFADGQANREELTAAWTAAWAAASAAAWAAASAAARTKQAHLLRDIVGNPFRPIPSLFSRQQLNASGHHWTATYLAQAAYDERDDSTGHLDPVRLAILADALEEAGCDNVDILAHLRSPGPHARGCWAIDLLTGRE